MKSTCDHLKLLCQIEDSLKRPTSSSPNTKRIAAFDADGTLWATDMGENFFNYQIQNKLVPLPDDPWAHYLNLKKVNNDPRSAYLWLAQINAGVPIKTVRAWAQESVQNLSHVPIFQEQRLLIHLLQRYGVEIYVVTASVTWAVEPAVKLLGLEPSSVIGVETKIHNNLVSSEGVNPITYKQGKVEALLQKTLGQRPFLASGNTSGDTALLESASEFAIAINSVPPGDRIYSSEQELQKVALEKNWPFFFWGT